MSRRVLAAACLASLLATGVVLLHLPAVRARVLDRARGYAQRELGIALTASALDYSLLARSIELRDLSIAAAPGEPPFLQADRAFVALRAGIFLGRVAIDRITVSRPRLTVIRH